LNLIGVTPPGKNFLFIFPFGFRDHDSDLITTVVVVILLFVSLAVSDHPRSFSRLIS
jgi:hypothetical protein